MAAPPVSRSPAITSDDKIVKAGLVQMEATSSGSQPNEREQPLHLNARPPVDYSKTSGFFLPA